MPNRRSVVTGIGLVSALGLGKDECFESMLAGNIGIDKVSSFSADKFACQLAGEAPTVKMNQMVPKTHRKSVKLMSRDIQMAVLAADDAMKDSGLNTRANNPDGPIDIDPVRSGVNIGAGSMCCDLTELSQAASGSTTDGKFDLNKWGAGGMESLTPLWLLKYLPNMLSCHVSIIYDLQGPSNCITCGESSGLMSIGEAYRQISRNKADIILAGGAESKVNAMNLMRYCLKGYVSTAYNDDPKQGCRPFDSKASGIVPAEGGGILVVEEYEAAKKRGAKIYAEITGFASSFNYKANDEDIMAPDPEAKGTTAAILKALENAGITAAELDLVVPNGNGLPSYDKAEAFAIKAALKDAADSVPVLATKSRLGSAGAGASAIDTAIAVMAMEKGVIPATLNCEEAIDDCSLNLTKAGNLEKEIKHALITSTSLGGQTAAIVISKVSE